MASESASFDLGAFVVAWVEWIHASKQPARRFRSIDEATRRVIAIWVVDGQVQNGGLSQALAAVPWMFADAIAGLRAHGESEMAALLEAMDDRAPDDADDRAWWDRAPAERLDARLTAQARTLSRPR